MWNVTGNNLQMAEGDYGVKLPITVSGPTFTASDELKLTIKAVKDGPPLVEKTFQNINQNTINFELTEAESALLPVGSYVYVLDWYQSSAFLCNIIPVATLKVVDKA